MEGPCRRSTHHILTLENHLNPVKTGRYVDCSHTRARIVGPLSLTGVAVETGFAQISAVTSSRRICDLLLAVSEHALNRCHGVSSSEV